MLYTPVNQFNWTADNFSDTYQGSVNGTLLTAGGAAHTKGSNTAAMVGLAEDCYGLSICFGSGSTDATIRRQMTDLLIDPAAGVGNAGSSWSVLINNLYSNGPSINVGHSGYRYFFPLFLKAGTALGAVVQDVVTSAACRMTIRAFGKPTHPELLKVGTKVQTLGATTASTSGVAVTPGTGTLGSYSASLGTLTNAAWFWQLGIGSNDTSMTENSYFFDVAEDATSKYLCMKGVYYQVASAQERSGKAEFGDIPPIHCAKAGQDVYVRGVGAGGPDSSMTAVVYAVS